LDARGKETIRADGPVWIALLGAGGAELVDFRDEPAQNDFCAREGYVI
jgi:hypothetical protein